MREQLLSFIAGASAAILGGVIGGFVQGWAWYRFELKRAAREKKNRWTEIALEWAAKGRQESLRHVNLEGADLRAVDLGPGKKTDKGADLSYANLRDAYLKEAILKCADLRGADLRGAKLRGANLEDAVLNSADLRGADLRKVKLQGATLKDTKHSKDTIWPKRFPLPEEMGKVDESWGGRLMNEQEWRRVLYVVTMILAVTLAVLVVSIPVAIVLGWAVRLLLCAFGA